MPGPLGIAHRDPTLLMLKLNGLFAMAAATADAVPPLAATSCRWLPTLAPLARAAIALTMVRRSCWPSDDLVDGWLVHVAPPLCASEHGGGSRSFFDLERATLAQPSSFIWIRSRAATLLIHVQEKTSLFKPTLKALQGGWRQSCWHGETRAPTRVALSDASFVPFT